MAGFPEEGKYIEIGHDPEQLAGPVSLSSRFFQQGPGPQTSSAANLTSGWQAGTIWIISPRHLRVEQFG